MTRPTGRIEPRAPVVAARGKGSLLSEWSRVFVNVSWLVSVAIVCAHVMLGSEDVPLVARVLLAVPAVLCVVETAAYMKNEASELPFTVVWLAQYYLAFGFEVFFDLTFDDMSGPVEFTAMTRIQGGLASALGALSFWVAARFIMRVGKNLPRLARSVLPPETPPSGWDSAFYVYAALTVFVSYSFMALPGLVPDQLRLVSGLAFAIPFALGIATARPPRVLGARASHGLLALGMLGGMFGGQIEPIGRTVVAYVAARLAMTRRLAVGMIVAMALLFLVLQPTKARYREQVWGYAARTGQSLSAVGRLEAWEDALGNFFTETTHKKKEVPAVSRITELGSVMHAIMVVPGRVDYAYGDTLGQILRAPIPRIIWPDKPDSRHEAGQQYAVIFGRQSAANVDNTAIGMCVLVEGYWNFGWFGIALVGVAMGVYIGVQQRLFSGSHWALFATGVAQIACISGSETLVNSYGSVFQYLVARLIGVWIMYQLAVVLGGKARGAGRTPVGLAGGAARR